MLGVRQRLIPAMIYGIHNFQFVISQLYFILFTCTFVITDSLHIYAVVPLSINKVPFVFQMER